MSLKIFRKLKKSQKISYLLLFVIFLYSTVITVHTGVESSVINSALDTLAIPNGFYFINFSTPEPEFQISVGLSNKGLADITNFEVNVTLNLSYVNIPTNQNIYEKFFEKQEIVGKIRSFSNFNHTISSELKDFNISVLGNFWVNVMNYSYVKFLMDVSISCEFYFGLIPFNIYTKELDLFYLNCPKCT